VARLRRFCTRARQFQQARHLLAVTAACIDVGEAPLHPLHHAPARAPAADQAVLQVRVALDRPHLAQHLVEHARRSPGAALGAQLPDQLPALGAEQPQHDLAVRERGVVVGDLAQARLHR